MSVTREIAEKVEQLPPALQEQVLRYVDRLSAPSPVGEPGAALLKFAGLLDPDSAREIMEAIEEGCERIDPDEE